MQGINVRSTNVTQRNRNFIRTFRVIRFNRTLNRIEVRINGRSKKNRGGSTRCIIYSKRKKKKNKYGIRR